MALIRIWEKPCRKNCSQNSKSIKTDINNTCYINFISFFNKDNSQLVSGSYENTIRKVQIKIHLKFYYSVSNI